MSKTAAANWINAEADAIERHANESKAGWIILGESEKYDAAMNKVNALRYAANIDNLHDRREVLRGMGYAF